MRTRREIQKAHDLLVAVIERKLPIEMSEVDRKSAMAVSDALAWVLQHKGRVAFAHNIEGLLAAVDRLGYTLQNPQEN